MQYRITSYCLKAGGGTLPYTVPLAGFFVYHSLFVTRTTHYWNIYHYETFHTLSICVWSSNHTQSQNVWVCWSSYYNILQHLTRNIRESSSTFNSTSRGDCSIFLCVIFKRYTFSCGKKEWPAGRPAGTRGNCDLTRVTLLPSKPSCAQSFWRP